MSQTAIPFEFERYLQNKMSVGEGPDMNQMIFAYIPDLDLGVPIDREDGLPDVSTWVYEQDVDQVGKLGDNALAYSVVIPSNVPAFTFNAIFLRDKNVLNSCGVAVYKIDETKEAGMSSTKSLLQSYTGAASIAGITVDASTWQIDYQARLFGIEEDQRLVNLDYYGHTAFINGFDVMQEDDPTKYTVSAGVVYLGGLRAELESDALQTIITKPNTIYVDVYRAGTVLSAWENIVSIVTSENELADYVDNGQQHYVAKIATIDADGNIADARVSGSISAALANRTISTTSPLSGGGDLSDDLTLTIQNGTTEQKGAVQLIDSVESESTTLAATANAVKTAYDLASAAASPGCLLASSGYQKLYSGLIIQWGSATASESTVENACIFPVTFPKKCCVWIGTAFDTVATDSETVVTRSIGTSSVVFFCNNNSGGPIAADTDVCWFAIGY